MNSRIVYSSPFFAGALAMAVAPSIPIFSHADEARTASIQGKIAELSPAANFSLYRYGHDPYPESEQHGITVSGSTVSTTQIWAPIVLNGTVLDDATYVAGPIVQVVSASIHDPTLPDPDRNPFTKTKTD